MQADLVAERRWISDERFREGFAVAQLAPGPLAAQLAMYIGWARDGALGAVVAGTAFVLPPFLMVIAAAAVYRRAVPRPADVHRELGRERSRGELGEGKTFAEALVGDPAALGDEVGLHPVGEG